MTLVPFIQLPLSFPQYLASCPQGFLSLAGHHIFWGHSGPRTSLEFRRSFTAVLHWMDRVLLEVPSSVKGIRSWKAQICFYMRVGRKEARLYSVCRLFFYCLKTSLYQLSETTSPTRGKCDTVKELQSGGDANSSHTSLSVPSCKPSFALSRHGYLTFESFQHNVKI